jgi:hypothetical protein
MPIVMMAAPASRAMKIWRTLGIIGMALWCAGLGLAVEYSYSRPIAPDPSRGRTYALMRPSRSGDAVYLTKVEYGSLAAIWGTGTVLLVGGFRSARRLSRTRPPSSRPPT